MVSSPLTSDDLQGHNNVIVISSRMTKCDLKCDIKLQKMHLI